MPTVRKKNIETKIRYSQLKSYLSNGYVLIDDQSESDSKIFSIFMISPLSLWSSIRT